jgi:hypothetical protein
MRMASSSDSAGISIVASTVQLTGILYVFIMGTVYIVFYRKSSPLLLKSSELGQNVGFLRQQELFSIPEDFNSDATSSQIYVESGVVTVLGNVQIVEYVIRTP